MCSLNPRDKTVSYVDGYTDINKDSDSERVPCFCDQMVSFKLSSGRHLTAKSPSVQDSGISKKNYSFENLVPKGEGKGKKGNLDDQNFKTKLLNNCMSISLVKMLDKIVCIQMLVLLNNTQKADILNTGGNRWEILLGFFFLFSWISAF